MRRYLTFTAFALVGCASYRPPGPQAPRPEATVQASFAATWDAVIDHFSERNITIVTIERASGIIVAAPAYVPGTAEARLRLADCGESSDVGLYVPTRVVYNVRVKGDSARSLMRVNANFESVGPGGSSRCSSKGVWEGELESAIRQAAEKR